MAHKLEHREQEVVLQLVQDLSGKMWHFEALQQEVSAHQRSAEFTRYELWRLILLKHDHTYKLETYVMVRLLQAAQDRY